MTVKAKARFTDREIFIETGGRPFILKRLADIETLWDNLADDACEDHIPYWTELWPASLAFAEWLCDHGDEIAGRSCLELGTPPPWPHSRSCGHAPGLALTLTAQS